MRNEEKKKKLKRLLIAFLILASASATAFFGYQAITRSVITKYDVAAENLTCTDSDQVRSFLSSQEIKYFTFKKEELEKAVKKKFFCVGKVSAFVIYPDKLKIEVFGREPAFVLVPIDTSFNTNPVITLPDDFKIATQSSMAAQPLRVIDDFIEGINEASASGSFLVDEEGVVFDSLNSPVSFPKLQVVGFDIRIGGTLEGDAVKKAREVTEGLRSFEAPTDNMIIIGDKLIVNSKPRVIFSLEKRLDYQIASLQLIVAQAKMNSDPSRPGSGDIESIDLRFDKPVVIYSKVKK
jgi:hypothetical protein